MAKKKSITSVRLSEVGKCLRLLYEARNRERKDKNRLEMVAGYSRSIGILSDYRYSFKAKVLALKEHERGLVWKEWKEASLEKVKASLLNS